MDAIRVVATLGVLLTHLTIYIPTGSVGNYLNYGASGVRYFFVLSGYLCACSFHDGVNALAYYKRRAARILPAYFAAVICGMLVHQYLLCDVTPDIFRLGWFRYFLGLNTILPSTNYYLWNNMYGLWSMGPTIGFYVLAPLIFRYTNTLNKSLLLFALSFVVKAIWEMAIVFFFGKNEVFDALDILCGASIFGTLYQFAFGIMTFFFIKEGKTKESTVFFVMCILAGDMLGKRTLLSCASCGILITMATSMEKSLLLNEAAEKVLRVFSVESYHIYLAHFIAYDIATFCVKELNMKPGVTNHALWFAFAIGFSYLLCMLMKFAESLVNSAVKRLNAIGR